MNNNLSQELVVKLIDSKLTLSIAESCTGGLASKVITDVPGSSEIFMGSVVAYNQIIKNKFLDIPIPNDIFPYKNKTKNMEV